MHNAGPTNSVPAVNAVILIKLRQAFGGGGQQQGRKEGKKFQLNVILKLPMTKLEEDPHKLPLWLLIITNISIARDSESEVS